MNKIELRIKDPEWTTIQQYNTQQYNNKAIKYRKAGRKHIGYCVKD